MVRALARPILYFATSLTAYFAARNFYDEQTDFGQVC